MKIIKIKVMRGPNYWSADRHKLIVLTLKLTEEEQQLEASLPQSAQLLPVQQLHFGSLQGSATWHELVACTAIEMQSLAGMDCDFYQAEFTSQAEVRNVVFSYTVERAGIYTAEAAVRWANAIITGEVYDIERDIEKLKRINRQEGLGPSTYAIVDEALKRDIPVTRLDESSLLMLGQGCNQRMVRAAVAGSTSSVAVDVVSNKELTKKILAAGFIPTPNGMLAGDLDELDQAINKVGFPLVIKPLNGNHGRGITTMIQSREDAVAAFYLAQKISADVIVERHIEGSDFRLLVINYKLVAAAKRTPAQVTGDGVSAIKQLVDKANADPRRGVGHEKALTTIKIDANTLSILAVNNLTPESVLPEGRVLNLKDTANISTGGTADDVTDQVHPQNVFLAERIARLLNLDICGIDIMAVDIAVPITNKSGAVLEVNAGPGLRMHLAPSSGAPRNVAAPIIQMLYPGIAPSRIPVVAVTGTNGKTTTTRLISHLAAQAGCKVGFTTTDGIYINGQLITQGDCSGPASAIAVLRDPMIDFAVLECARGGILRAGLGFDKCDISIVTNISQDHLGLEGIETIEQLARVKAVVPKSTGTSGYAILNADDDLVYQMKNDLTCHVALFSTNPGSTRLQQHLMEGKIGATIEDGCFVICQGELKTSIAPVTDVPLTMDGKAASMIKNVLPSVLAAYISNFDVIDIRNALKTFIPSPETTPGRMNCFDFHDFKLLVDYAHNEGGYQELKKYADQVTASVKVGVITAVGDRKVEEITKLAQLAAQIFDQLIIRHDQDRRGRTPEQLNELLLQGIRSVKPDMPVKVISDEIEAIAYAIDNAEKDAWIFVNIEKVGDSLQFVAQKHQMYMDGNRKHFAAA